MASPSDSWRVPCVRGFCTAHLAINPPNQQPKALGGTKTLGFHRDSGRVNQELEVPPSPSMGGTAVILVGRCTSITALRFIPLQLQQITLDHDTHRTHGKRCRPVHLSHD